MGITFSNPKLIKDLAEILHNFTNMFEILYSNKWVTIVLTFIVVRRLFFSFYSRGIEMQVLNASRTGMLQIRILPDMYENDIQGKGHIAFTTELWVSTTFHFFEQVLI